MVDLLSGLAYAVVASSLVRQSWFFSVCKALLGILAVLVAAIVCLQRRLIWPAQRANSIIMKDLATKREMKWGELLRLRPGVVAAFKPAPEVVLKKKVVVFFHGNGDDIAFVAPSLGYIFGRLGLGFCGVEYPGYGLAAEGTSQGPSESGAYAAAEEVLLHLEAAKGIRRKQMVLVGQSIGCGVAVEMAARGFGCGLVLVSPFSSLRAVATRVVSGVLSAVIPLLPRALTDGLVDAALQVALRDKFDNAAKVGQLFRDSHPLSFPPPPPKALVVSGTIDELVPHEQSKELANLFAEEARCQFMPLTGKGHNDVWEWAGEDGKSKARLAGFIATFAHELDHERLDWQ